MNDRVRSFEYKNDYFYIVIRQCPECGEREYAYCCGINISRFDPLCWQKAGIRSNPAYRGLQMLRADASAYSHKLGLTIKNAEHIPCAPMTPPARGWYRERTLLLGEATPAKIRKVLEFSVQKLIKGVLSVCAPDAKLPVQTPNPPAMQKYLDSLSLQQPRY